MGVRTHSTERMLSAKLCCTFTIHLLNALTDVSFEHFLWHFSSLTWHADGDILNVYFYSFHNPFKWNKLLQLLHSVGTLSFKSQAQSYNPISVKIFENGKKGSHLTKIGNINVWRIQWCAWEKGTDSQDIPLTIWTYLWLKTWFVWHVVDG